jgi:hypothetical protein
MSANLASTPAGTGKSPLNTRTILIALGIGLLIVIALLAAAFWYTSPRRTLNSFLQAIEEGNRRAALSHVSETINANKEDNIAWFVEDWLYAEQIAIEVERDEAWRSRVKTEVNDQGETVPMMNEHGFETKETFPTPRYWAHHYNGYVTVTFDEIEDPVIIKLKRDTDDTFSLWKQLFRSWKVTNITYQPLSEDEVFDLDLEGEDFNDLQFEIDEEGNVVVPEQGVSENGETKPDEGLGEEAPAETPAPDAAADGQPAQ